MSDKQPKKRFKMTFEDLETGATYVAFTEAFAVTFHAERDHMNDTFFFAMRNMTPARLQVIADSLNTISLRDDFEQLNNHSLEDLNFRNGSKVENTDKKVPDCGDPQCLFCLLSKSIKDTGGNPKKINDTLSDGEEV